MGEIIKTLLSIKFWKQLRADLKQDKLDLEERLEEQKKFIAQGYKIQQPERPSVAPNPPPVSGGLQKRC